MKKIDKLNNIVMVENEELMETQGGWGNISVNIDIPWHAVRDTLRGIGDGLFGHRRKY